MATPEKGLTEQLKALASKGLEVKIFIFKGDEGVDFELTVYNPLLIANNHCSEYEDGRILFICESTLETAVQRAYDELVGNDLQ